MLRCMRTTIRLDERLHGESKELAARNGTTLTALMEEAVRQLLARRDGPGSQSPRLSA
ncbi:MAG: ribbon-helix-helix domain-containing protein [Candidatus Limnocylindria bacterium]